jgi:drug/metabolite transporter (DMT)-like permease
MSEHDRTDERTTERIDFEPNPQERGRGLSAIIALLGLWMIAEAVLFDLVATQFWNDLIIGAVLVLLGGYNYSRRAKDKIGNVAAAVLAALLGLWLVASPFMFGAEGGLTEATNTLGFWNDVIVGLLVLIIGAYSAYAARARRRDARRVAS